MGDFRANALKKFWLVQGKLLYLHRLTAQNKTTLNFSNFNKKLNNNGLRNH